MSYDDLDTSLARLLQQEGRLELGTLQALLNQARGGAGTLGALLTHRGLLTPAELAGYMTQLESRLESQPGPHGRVHENPTLDQATPRKSTDRHQPKLSDSRIKGVPDQVGDYRIVKELGAGGMGAVYLTEHVHTGTQYALKLMRANVLGPRRERFQREGQAQAKSDAHPNVVRVHAAGEDAGRLFLAMDVCVGGDLSDRLEHGPLDPEEAARIAAELADGLQFVHDQGILHRDIKPANVLFDEAGTPKLVDFGLARMVDAETLTKTGAVMGTPAYMSPEQARGQTRELTVHTDIYSLGVLLYECLTGEVPFTGIGIAIIRAVIQDPPTPPSSVHDGIPKALERVCLKALAKDPQERFQTAAEFAAALRDPAGVEYRARRPPLGLLVGIAGGVLGLALGLALLVLSGGEPNETPDLGVQAQQLAEEAWHSLRVERPLDADHALPGQWRQRRDELRARLQDEGQKVPKPLREAEVHMLALEGLVALQAGDRQAALSSLARLRSLDPQAPGSLALRGALTTVDDDDGGDFLRALEDLRLAREGIARPELIAWQRQAHLRQALRELRRGEAVLALARLQEELQEREGIPPDLHAHVLAQVQERLRGVCSDLERRETKLDKKLRPQIIAQLRFVRLLEPNVAPLPPADFERWLKLALRPISRLSSDVELYVAELRPDQYNVQYGILKRFGQSASGVSKMRKEASLYTPLAERALRMASDPADRFDIQERLGELYTVTLRYEDGAKLADELLATRDLPTELRGWAHYWRSSHLCQQKAELEALRETELALEHFPNLHWVHVQRAKIFWQAEKWRASMDAGLRFLTVVKPSLEKVRIGGAYALAAWHVWAGSKRTSAPKPQAYADALLACQRVVENLTFDRYVGWRLRLADAQVLTQDYAGAQVTLERALEHLPRYHKTADLVQLTRELGQRVTEQDEDARERMHDLIEVLEERRYEGAGYP